MKYSRIREKLIYEYNPDQIEEQLQIWVEIFMKEYNNMVICSKNNINSIKCYEYFNNEEYFAIVMELCDKDLSKLLEEKILNTGKGFNIEEIRNMINQLNITFKIMEFKIRKYTDKI